MSELTKRLRNRRSRWLKGCHSYDGTEPDKDCTEAADRIEALEECLLEVMDAGGMAIDVRYDYGSFSAACAKARALLGEK